MAAVPIVSFQGQIERPDRGGLTSETAIAGMCAATTQSHVPRSPSLPRAATRISVNLTDAARPVFCMHEKRMRPPAASNQSLSRPRSPHHDTSCSSNVLQIIVEGTPCCAVPCESPSGEASARKAGVQTLRGLPCAAMILSGEKPLLRALRRGSLGACMC